MSLSVTLKENGEEVYWANITHNLSTMAQEAGIYEELWSPNGINAIYASDIIAPLTEGLIKMALDPEYYEKFNSPNGWGMYCNFLPWIAKYIKACSDHPDALIEVSV